VRGVVFVDKVSEMNTLYGEGMLTPPKQEKHFPYIGKAISLKTLKESYYKLNPQEQQLILILASRIDGSEDYYNTFKLRVSEINFPFETSSNAENKLTLVKDALLGFQRKSISYKDGQTTITRSWLLAIAFENDEEQIGLQFNFDLKELLMSLRELHSIQSSDDVTRTNLTLGLTKWNSVYSIRIYRMLKSNLSFLEQSLSLGEFKDLLGIEQDKYPLYGHLKNKVINPAIREIAEKTDISLSVKEFKKGRKVVGLSILNEGINH
jgi:plasmid replication initiation protein